MVACGFFIVIGKFDVGSILLMSALTSISPASTGVIFTLYKLSEYLSKESADLSPLLINQLTLLK